MTAGGCWPTDDQLLLLRAALLAPEEAREAWSRWRKTNTLEGADAASTRLLPLVYRNLVAAGVDEPDRSKLRGSYRAAWLRNQLLFAAAARAVGALEAAGIPTMLLKGAALALADYGDAGVRPMDDADVLVPWREAERALAVLVGEGWLSAEDEVYARGLRTAHAHHVQDWRGLGLDLHRSVLAQSSSDESFWSASREVALLGVRTRVLSPADQLLHVVVHGAGWNPSPPVWWLADAFAVERSAGADLDWDRFVLEAARRRVTLAVERSMRYLRETLAFPVPDTVLARLRSVPKGRFERWVHSAQMRPAGGGSRIPVALDEYVRRSRLDPSLRPDDFLRALFRVETNAQLARRLAGKAAETAITQTAVRVAPGRIASCDSCGRVFVRLRGAPAPACATCAR